jgi:uncharacterized protein YkwD
VRGGGTASDAEVLLEKQLAARGDEAKPDGALADTAAWFLLSAYKHEDISGTNLGIDAAHRFGFAGEYLGCIVLQLDRDDHAIEAIVRQVPKNSAINRYGIVAGQGRDVAIAIGGVHLSLDDFPRGLEPGAALHLKGQVSERYRQASVFSTSPDGKVRETPMKDRTIDASVRFADVGVHKLEIMGYGQTGPDVLLNVPIHVGVPLPVDGVALGAGADPNLTAEMAEATLLSLLNEERTKRGLSKVEADAELRTVALAHSVDMTENHFFSHVSPTTKSAEDRVAKAKVRISKVGECLALDATPASAHQGLLGSPAHRAAMLDPVFTHVGIGVAFDEPTPGTRRFRATLLFGRRPPTDDTALSADQIVEIIQAGRSAQKLPALRVDPTLASAAGVAARAVKEGKARTAQEIIAVSDRELNAAVQRTRVTRISCTTHLEMIDRYELSLIPVLKRAELRAIGVATATVETDVGKKASVIIISDAGAGKVMKSCD